MAKPNTGDLRSFETACRQQCHQPSKDYYHNTSQDGSRVHTAATPSSSSAQGKIIAKPSKKARLLINKKCPTLVTEYQQTVVDSGGKSGLVQVYVSLPFWLWNYYTNFSVNLPFVQHFKPTTQTKFLIPPEVKVIPD